MKQKQLTWVTFLLLLHNMFIKTTQSLFAPQSMRSLFLHGKGSSRRCSSRSLSSQQTTAVAAASRDSLIEKLSNEEIITSTKSKTVKLYQNISRKAKHRNEMQMTVVEGHRLVIDTIAEEASRNLYHDVLVSHEALNHPKLGQKLSRKLEDLIQSNGHCRVRLADQNVINAACDTVTPQGVVALVGIPNEHEFASNMMMNERESTKKKLFLILDAISDPGNVGTLIRSAKATGVEAIVLLPNCCDVYNPKAVRSAMGSSFHVPICSMSSWDDCLSKMVSIGVTGKDIFAATMEGSKNEKGITTFESKPHYEIDWHEADSIGKALIVGKEVRREK